jgi:hypothetical protein
VSIPDNARCNQPAFDDFTGFAGFAAWLRRPLREIEPGLCYDHVVRLFGNPLVV